MDPLDLATALADRYSIDREIGSGGMAYVYLAQDLKHSRSVAIKVLRPEYTTALGASRFLREIGIAARLTHPNILPLHDSGESDGFLYYVMPYIQGESLRDRLKRESELPLEEAIQIQARLGTCTLITRGAPGRDPRSPVSPSESPGILELLRLI